MSFTPKTWNTGDRVNASDMNRIEQGIADGGGVMIITSSFVNGIDTLDKTAQEIYDAFINGTPVYLKLTYGTFGSDYLSHTSLAPVTYIYTYETTGVIRVCINRPKPIGGISSKDYLLGASVVIYEASGTNQHPTLYTTVRSSSYALD